MLLKIELQGARFNFVSFYCLIAKMCVFKESKKLHQTGQHDQSVPHYKLAETCRLNVGFCT